MYRLEINQNYFVLSFETQTVPFQSRQNENEYQNSMSINCPKGRFLGPSPSWDHLWDSFRKTANKFLSVQSFLPWPITHSRLILRYFFPWLLVNLDLQYPGTTSSIFHLWNCSPGTSTLSFYKLTLSISRIFQLSSGYLKSFYIWIEMTVLATSSSIKSTLSTTVSDHLYK